MEGDETPLSSITAAEVKAYARELGADVVGIAPAERWEGAPIQMDPRQIMPDEISHCHGLPGHARELARD